MSVCAPIPWIQKELNLTKFPVLGHCFGTQLMNGALGRKVSPMKDNEIGWYQITFANNQAALTWRGFLLDDIRFDAITMSSPFQKVQNLFNTTSHCEN